MEVVNMKFAWKIKDFSKIQQGQIICSDVFSLGPCKWKIAAYPKGYYEDNDFSIYLRVVDSETLPSGWTVKAIRSFTLVDQIDNKSSYTRSGDRTREYNADGSSWGYHSFISHKDLHDPKKGYLLDDTCIIKADITVYGNDYFESHVASNETSKEDLTKSATEDDMDAFFVDLNSVIFPKKVVTLEEEARQAVAMIEESLNMAPAKNDNAGRMSQLKNAFDFLSSMDDCSILTSEQKAELVSMKDNFIDLSKRAALAVKDKNLFNEKELVKKSLDEKLGRCLITFEKAKAETMQYKQDITMLQEQIVEKKRKEEDSTSKQKQMFTQSKELKAELDVLIKQWPVYEARMNAAEEEEKVVGTEWSKMKQQFSSLKKPFY